MPALSDLSALSPNAYHEFSSHGVVVPRMTVHDRLTPNDTQKITLIVAASYTVVIGILWYVS